MRRIVLTLVFVISALLLVAFFSVDACFDAGGVWNNLGLACEGVKPDFTPQYMRGYPMFWVVVILLSGIITLLVSKVVLRPKH